MDAPYADVLVDSIPDLNYKVSTVQQIGMFGDPKDDWTRYSHYGFLIAFAVLVTAEWITRKVVGLV